MRAALRAAALGAFVTALAAAGPARADAPPASSDPGAPADDLFRSAGLAYDAGQFQLAHTLYSQAFAKKQTHDIAAMLAQTEMKLGRPCDAAEHLAYAVGHFPPSLTDERRLRIEHAYAAVKKAIGALRVDVLPSGSTVQVDFQPVAERDLPGPFCVSAGDHVVFVSQDGFAVERRTLTIEPEKVANVVVEMRRIAPLTTLPPLPPASTTAAPTASARAEPKAKPRDATRPVAFTVLAAGLTGVLSGAILLPFARAKQDEADALLARVRVGGGYSACSGPTDFASDCARLRALRSDAAAFGNVGLTSLLAGATLSVAAGGFLLLGPSIAGVRPGGPRVTVGVASDGAHVALTGAF